jgi:hypothetical protein
MNVQFAIAGALSLIAAAIHGGAGEALVVRKLHREALSPSRFGGPSMTMVMIRATWHITTLAFAVIGASLAVCAPGSPSQACAGIGRLAAIAFASFAVLAIGLGIAAGPRWPRALMRHPGPLIFVLVAVLAWRGSIS